MIFPEEIINFWVHVKYSVSDLEIVFRVQILFLSCLVVIILANTPMPMAME